jgi:hypothetical protein
MSNIKKNFKPASRKLLAPKDDPARIHGPDPLWVEIHSWDRKVQCHVTRSFNYQLQKQRFYSECFVFNCVRNVPLCLNCKFLKNMYISCTFYVWSEYQVYNLGGKGGRCVRLTTLPQSCAVVMKSGNLNFLEPSGPLQACNGTALPYLLCITDFKNGANSRL